MLLNVKGMLKEIIFLNELLLNDSTLLSCDVWKESIFTLNLKEILY